MNKEMTVVQCQWVQLMQCDIKKTSIIKNNRINNSDITQTIQQYKAKAFLEKHKEIDGETKVKAYGRMAGQVLHGQHVRQTEDFAT